MELEHSSANFWIDPRKNNLWKLKKFKIYVLNLWQHIDLIAKWNKGANALDLSANETML
jgi:hypothetical protein